MKTILLTDLDDTLFQSLKKCPPGADLSPGASLADGRLFSWMTEQQRELLRGWHGSGAEIWPVTARTLAAYRRVVPQFGAGAVVQHGGLILDAAGQVDPLWYAQMQAQLAPYRQRLAELAQEITDFAQRTGVPADVRVTSEEGLDFYVLLKHRDRETRDLGEWGDQVQRMAERTGFWQHRNGNNLAFLPDPLAKEIAVQELLQRLRDKYGSILVLGAGDSRSDLPFMSLCDYCIFPRVSQIAEVAFA